ncbi:toprim domain-containing protein [Brevibacillus laterosporus]|uniref:toprim domain-containing protein n=1 Tax=Brevibacillus laterosporus TaxID=1465 RepID=UPI0018CDF207|nr:toprim domain-containing protein [Brevibacillus laterosporus]MBG9788731.1 DNA primase [Brevibacillus laterosporus]
MQIDIRAELEQFPWTAATWTDDRLLAASPFRWDRSPSFYVWLRDSDNPRNNAKAGYWGDMGAKDPDYQHGGIVKLLAFLREETEEETQDYLRWKYGEGTVDPEALTLDLSGSLRMSQARTQTLDSDFHKQYTDRDHPYLSSRGITEEVQRLFQTGYDPRTNAITIPWFNADGTLGNVKYRKVNEKTFWYAKGGRPIREMVYGLDIVYRQRITGAVLVESEIDAMYLWSAGVPAVALGGSVFSEEKAEALRKSPIEIIGVMADHDKAGQKMKRAVVGGLSGYMMVNVVGYPIRYKDPNEIKNKAELNHVFTDKKSFIKINFCKGNNYFLRNMIS